MFAKIGNLGGMYIVPNVPLIPQTQTMACWFASAQMLIQWRREKTQSSELGINDPSEDSTSMALFAANGGISDGQALTMAHRLGLRTIPPMSPTSQIIENWLKSYGPLWTNGASHITVIAGADPGGDRVYVNDPWPPNIGKIEWRPMSWLGGMSSNQTVASLDPNTDTGVFLHLP